MYKTVDKKNALLYAQSQMAVSPGPSKHLMDFAGSSLMTQAKAKVRDGSLEQRNAFMEAIIREKKDRTKDPTEMMTPK